MTFSTYIRTIGIALAVTAFSASELSAARLTSQEMAVCKSLDMCVDIIRRHDASEFDYNVLEAEFRRFGASGRWALWGVLESKAGNPDIAGLIVALAPLSPSERQNLQKNWTPEKAELYLPLFMDGHIGSREILLMTLGSPKPDVRDQARTALLGLQKSVKEYPISSRFTKPIVEAIVKHPVAAAAPYISKLNSEGHEVAFTSLLRSGETSLVRASYEALYRQNPAQAFQSLLKEMDRIQTSEQARAIGDMILSRHANRADGFYLKFAQDISGDEKRSVMARAVGLHAVLTSKTSAVPEMTQARAEALQYLVMNEPQVTQQLYLPKLQQRKVEPALNIIWDVAMTERWTNRDQISAAFTGLKTQDRVIVAMLGSDDARSFSAGVAKSMPRHAALLRQALGHPVKSIRELARKGLKLSPQPDPKSTCVLSTFDSSDRVNQMPFFDSPWLSSRSGNNIRVDRKFLISGHPSRSGWLAGYNLQELGLKSYQLETGLVFFDNKTGSSQPIGKFSEPMTILPFRALKLGESTDRFWVIDRSENPAVNISVYRVDLTNGPARVQHMGAIPNTAYGFSVAPNGDLLMRFKEKGQAPLRLTQNGDLSLACRSSKTVSGAPAPN